MEDDGALHPSPLDNYFLIEPLPEVIVSLAQMSDDKPISIVGIVKHDPDDYQNSRAAYFAWGQVYQQEVTRVGANHMLAGRVLSDLYQNATQWDEVSITDFDNAKAFLAVAGSEAVLNSIELRRACMVDSYVLVVEDFDPV